MTFFRSKQTQSPKPLPLILALVALSLIFTITRPANAQGGPARDAAAIAVLQSSVTAMGGVGVWQSIQDWTIVGTLSTNGFGQGTSDFNWTGAGPEFRMETDTGATTSVFFSGHRSPARTFNGSVFPLNYFVARANPPLYLPGVRLLQELNNQILTIQYVGRIQVHGVPAVQIHVSDDSNAEGSLVTPHEWYFDATTFLPLEVQFRLPPNENAGDYLSGTLDFWQFQTVNSLSVPTQITISRANAPTKTITVGSVKFNSGVPQSTFDPPQGVGQ